MSWSINFIGSPENIVAAIEKESERLTGMSKQEFDNAKPNIIGIVKQNFNKNYPVVIHVQASGHATTGSGEELQRSSCSCAITAANGQVV